VNILVIGATGYIGTAVSDALARAGHAVSGLARTESARSALAARGIEPIVGDIQNTERLGGLVREFAAVVWAATADAGAAADAHAVDVCIERLTGTGKAFVYTSGAWVHGDTAGVVADERSPLRPPELVSFRVPLERRVLDAPDMRGVVLRPGIVYGHGAGIPSMLVSSVRERGAARFVGSGDNHWPLVFLDDLAELYVKAVESAAPGTVLLAVQGPPLTVGALAQAASSGAGAGGRTLAWPLVEARRELGSFADALVLDQIFSARRAEQLLGWRPRGPSLVDELLSGSYARAS
jgi:nucleoside-diphosphate-sugar epimerase